MNLNVNGNAFTDRVPEEAKSKGLSSVKIKKKHRLLRKVNKKFQKYFLKNLSKKRYYQI